MRRKKHSYSTAAMPELISAQCNHSGEAGEPSTSGWSYSAIGDAWGARSSRPALPPGRTAPQPRAAWIWMPYDSPAGAAAVKGTAAAAPFRAAAGATAQWLCRHGLTRTDGTSPPSSAPCPPGVDSYASLVGECSVTADVGHPDKSQDFQPHNHNHHHHNTHAHNRRTQHRRQQSPGRYHSHCEHAEEQPSAPSRSCLDGLPGLGPGHASRSASFAGFLGGCDSPAWGIRGGGRMLLLASLSTSVAAAAGVGGATTVSGATASGSTAAAAASPTAAGAATCMGTPAAAATAALATPATSAASYPGSKDGVGAGGAGARLAGSAGGLGGLWQGFHLPQLSIKQLPGPPAFAEEQQLAQELLDYHTAKNGGFPRPCPRCTSSEFMVRRTAAGGTGGEGSGGGSGGSGRGIAAAAAAAGGGAAAAGTEQGVVEWRSRPLRCELCGAWVHLGCAGVGLVEQLPPQPWFHSPACRDTFLRLEAAATRNPHPSVVSPSHSLYILTPADIAMLAARLAAASVEDLSTLTLTPASTSTSQSLSAASAPGAAPRLAALNPGGSPRGPTHAVMPLLSQGFNPEAIQGFGEPAREYDGGKYSAVLSYRGQPVAAATFNVFGPEAQLCLLATAAQHRRRGHGSVLVADLEAALAGIGVSRLLVQSRGRALPLEFWIRRHGYGLVEPEEAARLHSRLPLAYYDCPLLEKRLPPPLLTPPVPALLPPPQQGQPPRPGQR